MEKENRNQVFKPLVAMTLPVIIGMLITFIFQLADTYFIGKLGVQQLAAMSFTYPVYIMFIGLFMGMSSGVSSTVAKALGQKDTEKAKSLSAVSVTIFVILGVLLGISGLFYLRPLFRILGAKGEILNYLQEYMGIMFPGFFLLVGTLIINSILMANGIMIKTTTIMVIGGIINIILDYLLIFGFANVSAMGIRGASTATVFSWGVTFVLMIILVVRKNMISFSSFRFPGVIKDRAVEILKIGLPAVAAQILNPFAVSILTRLISQSGGSSIAAYGIVTKVESLGLTVVLALSVILTPFVARLYGAKESKDIDRVIAYSGRITVYWSLAFFVILLLWGKNIISNFTSDAETISQGQLYFYIVGISLPAFGLSHLATSIFNGAQMPGLSLKLTMVKSLILMIPLAMVGSIIGVYGIYIGISIANIIGALYAERLLNKWHRESGSSLASHNPLQDYVDDLKKIFTVLRRK